MMEFEAHVASHIQEGSKPLNPILNSIHGARDKPTGTPAPRSCAEESGGVRLPRFFWLVWQHIRGASRARCPPQFRTLGWGWGFYGSPTLGTARDSVRVPTIARLLSCTFHAPDSLPAV